MRKLLKCPVTVALLILWAALSVVGYLGKDTIYKNYTVDIRTTPYFVLVFDGLHDGIFPWSHNGCAGRHRRERKAAVHPAAGGECL